jgi:hypothetical protein
VSAFGGAAFDAVAYDTTPVTLALPVRVDISALQSPSVPVIVSIVAPAIAAGTETVTDGGAVWPLSGGWWSRSVASMSAIACSAK